MSTADSCFGRAAGELIATKAATVTIKKTNMSFFAMFASSRLWGELYGGLQEKL